MIDIKSRKLKLIWLTINDVLAEYKFVFLTHKRDILPKLDKFVNIETKNFNINGNIDDLNNYIKENHPDFKVSFEKNELYPEYEDEWNFSLLERKSNNYIKEEFVNTNDTNTKYNNNNTNNNYKLVLYNINSEYKTWFFFYKKIILTNVNVIVLTIDINRIKELLESSYKDKINDFSLY